MGSVEQLEDGTFKATVEISEITVNKCFKHRNDADLWVAYKEDLFNQINAFDSPIDHIVLLCDAIDMKKEDLCKNGEDKRQSNQFDALKRDFSEWMNKPLSYLTYGRILEKIKSLSRQQVSCGGGRRKGETIILSPKTIRNKLALLSSCISLQIEKGCPVENNFLKVIAWFRKEAGIE